MSVINKLMLFIIFSLLISSFFKKDKIVSALFLTGLTQIGMFFPILGKIRFEFLIGIFSILIVLLSSNNLNRLSAKTNPISKYYYFFIIITILSIPFSVSKSDSIYWFIYYCKRCFILFFLVVVLLDDQTKIKNFIWMYLIGITWLSFGAFHNYLTGSNIVIVGGVERVRGITGLLSNPNGLANTLVGALPIIYYIFVGTRNKITKLFLIASGVTSFIAIFMTGSRGGFIGLTSTLFFISLFSKNKLKNLIIATIILITSLAMIGPQLFERYSTILQLGNSDISAHSRLDGLVHGISMLIKRPLLGVGIGCYPVARKKWFNWSLWAHNHYGQLMGELGILGTISWSLLVYHTIKSIRALRQFVIHNQLLEKFSFIYHLTLGIEVATYVRLILGMTTHSLHIFFWYLNAGLVVTSQIIIKETYLKNNEINV